MAPEHALPSSDAILEQLRPFGSVLAIKLFRLTLDRASGVPELPCLDHEATLHEDVDPHLAAYLRDHTTGGLHEVVFVPSRQRIEIDTTSTWGEASPESRDRLQQFLTRVFPHWRIRETRPSRWRGERRVASVCRAQVTLSDVLLDADAAGVTARIARLQAIGALMEKQSRVASWGVRTMTGPLVAAAGVASYMAMGSLVPVIGADKVTYLRYTVVGLLGALFLYYGLKAVQLTEISNRVWKRATEYSLILAERRRLADATPKDSSGGGFS